METSKQGPPSIKKKPSRERRMTVMIMGKVGRVRSFKISPQLILWSGVFLLAYIILSVLAINRYFDLRQAHLRQSEKVDLLEKKATEKGKGLRRSKDHVAFLEDYLRSLEEPKTEETETARAEAPQRMAVRAVVESVSPERKGEGLSQEEADLVAIEDMVIQKEDSSLAITFRLVNAKQGESAVRGYIHIIGKGDDDRFRQDWTYPREKLVNGVPTNHKRGQLFLIQRFKPIEGRFNLAPNAEQPSAIKVLVYDQSGVLILEREFEVRNEP